MQMIQRITYKSNFTTNKPSHNIIVITYNTLFIKCRRYRYYF